MFDLFYTLFKYKEKDAKDELGYYPEKVNVSAFPERRFLWTSRFLVVISCISMCITMILGSVICLMIPQKKSQVMPLQIDYKKYEVIRMQYAEYNAFAGNLVTESVMADYIMNRYAIGEEFEELVNRYNENEFLYLASSDEVWSEFERTERPYFEMLQKTGVRRRVVIEQSYPVSFNFWQVRFKTIDTYPNSDEKIVSSWLASIRVTFSFTKYDNKKQGLKNPYGTSVVVYNLSFLGRKAIKKKNNS
jgi:type IV secretory pathway component VirB8